MEMFTYDFMYCIFIVFLSVLQTGMMEGCYSSEILLSIVREALLPKPFKSRLF